MNHQKNCFFFPLLEFSCPHCVISPFYFCHLPCIQLKFTLVYLFETSAPNAFSIIWRLIFFMHSIRTKRDLIIHTFYFYIPALSELWSTFPLGATQYDFQKESDEESSNFLKSKKKGFLLLIIDFYFKVGRHKDGALTFSFFKIPWLTVSCREQRSSPAGEDNAKSFAMKILLLFSVKL